MDTPKSNMMQQHMTAAGALLPAQPAQHVPHTLAVAVSVDKVALALNVVLLLAATALAKSQAGGDRHLLRRACDSLREQIGAIDRAEAAQAAAEAEALTGTAVQAHTRAALARAFGLARSESATAAMMGNRFWNA